MDNFFDYREKDMEWGVTQTKGEATPVLSESVFRFCKEMGVEVQPW